MCRPGLKPARHSSDTSTSMSVLGRTFSQSLSEHTSLSTLPRTLHDESRFMIVTRFVRVCGARGWFGVLRQVMKATERTFFLDGRARVDRYSHRKWCLRVACEDLSRSGDAWSDRGKNWSKTGHSCVARHWERLRVHQVYDCECLQRFLALFKRNSSYRCKIGG